MLESAIGFEHLVGETITTTPTHPFYVPQKGWTEAIQLRAGDILVTCNGEYVVVELVQHELLEAPITVYNFEVEDFHTYYVAANEDAEFVLVHNKCGEPYDDFSTGRTQPNNLKEKLAMDSVKSNPMLQSSTGRGCWSGDRFILYPRLAYTNRKMEL